MACSNCFNGCAEIVSDQCVKYTGIPIPGLGIATGDPLLVVENQIINKILELITGEGIIPILEPLEICPLVSSFLPVSGDITLNQVISALIRSICALDGRITTVEGTLTTLNADYVIGCLTGVAPNSGTHDILQAAVTKLCSVSSDLATLTAELFANYVLINDINDYIAAYLAGGTTTTLYNTKMIPWVAVPYFGVTTGFFDITGAGIGDWEKIYLCNGQNLTPDLRGRGLVGNTTMGNTAFNPAVDPTIPNSGNPTYAQGDLKGANMAVLTSPSQLPLHDHPVTVTITETPHTHTYSGRVVNTKSQEGSNGNFGVEFGTYTSSANVTGLKGNGNGPNPNVTVVVGAVGGVPSAGHPNIQPVYSTNFIIYIP